MSAPTDDDPFAKAAAASSTSLPSGGGGGAPPPSAEPLVTFHHLSPRYPSPRPSSSSSPSTTSPTSPRDRNQDQDQPPQSSLSIYQHQPPAHHVLLANGTLSAFRNPWPSFAEGGAAAAQGGGHRMGAGQVIHARFLSRERKYVPVPTKKEELVGVVVPDWGWGFGDGSGGCCGGGGPPVDEGGLGGLGKEVLGGEGLGKEVFGEGMGGVAGTGEGKGNGGGNPNATKMKATWIGHASWLVETGVKRKAPIWTPSITLTVADDEAGDGKATTRMLELKSDDEEEEEEEEGEGSEEEGGKEGKDDDDDDGASSSSSEATAGPDDKTTEHSSAAEKKETGGKRGKETNKTKKKKKKKKKTQKEGHVERGIRILCDPVFSTRMSPVRFAGPKRFMPPPCALADLPDPVDVVVISHDHYDHLDGPTIRFLVDRERKRQHRLKSAGRGILFLCGLGVGRHLQGMGVRPEEIVELDWWEGVRVAVRGVKGAVRVIATPSQHFSGRGVWDAGKALWCSWVVEEVGLNDDDMNDDGGGGGGLSGLQKRANEQLERATGGPKRLYFAGDTGYRSVPPAVAAAAAAADGGGDPDDALARLPRCPAFAEIGELYGPFDLALLPIGCYSPRAMLSPVHAAPEDAVCMHRDLRSRRSVAMHYGTVRMPLSEQYEDVREPPRRWRECAERDGLRWGEEAVACKIGETVLV
ncbi:metallo-hydrolase oxidoreductase [Diplodia corticola]|uniref:Metallo-hydrolase oxidoreductase n=1 Tax=Diplodia corticola TaxID=236234 RepID=A0A1J9QKB9_9PEZI|nr:metallo-hydrolase oxidoreductase [Diplodia corticola]OJD28921.1 metallo-hydrolase oxidoreductase [Diplodia corticola]